MGSFLFFPLWCWLKFSGLGTRRQGPGVSVRVMAPRGPLKLHPHHLCPCLSLFPGQPGPWPISVTFVPALIEAPSLLSQGALKFEGPAGLGYQRR